MKQETIQPVDIYEPLIINGLHGRVLRLRAAKKAPKREILLIYGHHSSLERMLGVAQNLVVYGNVTMPDLPGFGGMDSFYKIGEKPIIDNLADYLATFIKLNYRQKRILIGGMSFGCVIATRMLQKYPEIASQVDLMVSLVGFSHKNDFKLKRRTIITFKCVAGLFKHRLPAAFVKYCLLRRPLITLAYLILAKTNPKLRTVDKKTQRQLIRFEVYLWQCNDIRTYMDTTVSMMRLNLSGEKIKVPLLNVMVNNDQYFNHQRVTQHFKQIYPKVKNCLAKLPTHAPTVISDSQEVEAFFTPELRRELKKMPKY